MCPDPDDRKRAQYIHMEVAMRSIVDSCQFLEHGGLLDREVFLGKTTPQDEIDHARKMARTFTTFIDSDDPAENVFRVTERGGDAELTHYEQFVLVKHHLNQE